MRIAFAYPQVSQREALTCLKSKVSNEKCYHTVMYNIDLDMYETSLDIISGGILAFFLFIDELCMLLVDFEPTTHPLPIFLEVLSSNYPYLLLFFSQAK